MKALSKYASSSNNNLNASHENGSRKFVDSNRAGLIAGSKGSGVKANVIIDENGRTYKPNRR